MDRRVDNAIGALAGVTAVTSIAVFGYLTFTTPGPGLGWIGGSPSAAPAVAPRMVAIEEVEDHDYKFRLVAPEPKWRVFDHAAADEAWFEANAAMLSDAGLVQLFVARVGDVTLEQAATAAITWMRFSTKEKRTIRWLARDAVEMKFDASRDVRVRVFVRDGYLYRLEITAFAGATGLTEADFPALWSSLTLLDGAVEPAAFTPVPRDKRGLDWRVESGRWENASGLAVAPPQGWRLLTGRTLRRARPDVDVELVDSAWGCYVTLDLSATLDVPATGSALPVKIAGETHKLVDLGPVTLSQKWATQIEVDGWPAVIEILVPTADGDRAIERVKNVLAAFTRLDVPQRRVIANDVITKPYRSTSIGDDWADRNGTFVHYPSGLVWARPADGIWRLGTGAEAAARISGGVLVADNLQSSMTVAIAPDESVAAPGGAATWLEEAYDERAKKVDLSVLRVDLRDGAELAWVDNKVKRVHRVGVLTGANGKTFRVHIWGPLEALEADQALLVSALSGVAITSVEPVDDAGEYVHRPWGVGVGLPGWRRENRADGPYLDVQWNHDDRELIGITVESTGSPTSAVTIAEATSLASAAVGAGADFSPQRGADRIGGEPAVRVSWQEGSMYVAVLIVEHHEFLYTIIVRGTEATLATAKRVFRFVDPA